MKEGWKYCELGDCCIKAKNINWRIALSSFKYIDLSAVDRDNSSIGHTVEINSQNAPSRAKQIVLKDDIIFATTRPTLRRLALIPEYLDNNICSTGFCVLRPDKTIVHPKWIFYTLKCDNFYSYLEPLQTGASYPAVTDSIVKKYCFSFPSLSEQQRIVSRLDASFAKIDALSKQAEEALEHAKALFQAELKVLMEKKEGWEEKKLGDICDTITDFVAAGSFADLRKNVVYNDTPDYAQLVRTMDLKSSFSKGKMVYVSESAFNYLYRVNLDKECIVLPNVGVNCGEVYYVEPKILPYNNNVLGPNAVMVRTSSANMKFLSYAFMGINFQKQLYDITSHMAQPKFNKTGLKTLTIFIPPYSEQERIVQTLDTLSQSISQLQQNYNQTLANCQALKQAILKETFE